MKKRFETAYGPAGDWARLFGRSPDYLGMKLSADVLNPGCYLTMDYWTSSEAYEQFRREHVTEYETIDAKCEELTEAEREIGRFRRLV
jgi:hypothetical protein